MLLFRCTSTEIKFLAYHVVVCLLLRRNDHAPGRAIVLMTHFGKFGPLRRGDRSWLSRYLRIISVVIVIYPGFAPIVLALIVYFTVTGGNEVRVDHVLIQPFLFYYVNQVVFMLTSLFQHNFPKTGKKVCITQPYLIHSKARVLSL